MFFFFFFQAEDGIRDVAVTGVQTCALPISLVPSIDFPFDSLLAADPDYLFLLPCGFDADRALKESRVLTDRPDWGRLSAVRDGRTWVLDGNAYFSRPGPRVVDGIELLGSLLHPDRVPTPAGTRSIHLASLAGSVQ